MKHRFSSEAELAERVIRWLNEGGWETWQEVSLGLGEHRADIVARRGSVLWIIETKLALSLDVMAQAEYWTGHANMVSVAAPTRRVDRFRQRILGIVGAGYIGCDYRGETYQHISPRFQRRRTTVVERALAPEHKTMLAAGSNGGGYFTPFRATMNQASAYIAANPGCTIKDLVANLGHHYRSDATARSCVGKWLGTDQLPALLRREGKATKIYPVLDRNDSAGRAEA